MSRFPPPFHLLSSTRVCLIHVNTFSWYLMRSTEWSVVTSEMTIEMTSESANSKTARSLADSAAQCRVSRCMSLLACSSQTASSSLQSHGIIANRNLSYFFFFHGVIFGQKMADTFAGRNLIKKSDVCEVIRWIWLMIQCWAALMRKDKDKIYLLM